MTNYSNFQTVAFKKTTVRRYLQRIRSVCDQAHTTKLIENPASSDLQGDVLALKVLICIVEFTLGCFEQDEILIETTDKTIGDLQKISDTGENAENLLSTQFLEVLKKSLSVRMSEISPETQKIFEAYFSEWCLFLEGVIFKSTEKMKPFTERLLRQEGIDFSVEQSAGLKDILTQPAIADSQKFEEFYAKNYEHYNKLLKIFEEMVDQDFLLKSKEDKLLLIFDDYEVAEPEDMRKKMTQIKNSLNEINQIRSESFVNSKNIYKQILKMIASIELSEKS